MFLCRWNSPKISLSQLAVQILALPLRHYCHLLTGSEVPPVQQQEGTAFAPKSPSLLPRPPLAPRKGAKQQSNTTAEEILGSRWYLQPQHCSHKIRKSTSMWVVTPCVAFEGIYHHLTVPNCRHGYKRKSILTSQ